MSKVQYFEAKVEFLEGTTSQGKDKIRREYLLVDAQSVTEAEAKITDHLSQVAPNADFKVALVKNSNIVEVIG